MGPAATDDPVARPFEADLDNELLVPRFVDALSTIAATSSFLATLIGVLVLIGWSLDAEALLRFIPGLTAMNPATAIGFICSGCALGLIATQPDLPLARAGWPLRWPPSRRSSARRGSWRSWGSTMPASIGCSSTNSF